MVKVRQIVGGVQTGGLGGSLAGGSLAGSSLAGGSLAGGLPGNSLETPDILEAGARSVPWFRAQQTFPLSFFVVYILVAIGFLGAAIYNFVDVHTEASSGSQNTMSIIFLVLAIWFVIGWPLVVQSLA